MALPLDQLDLLATPADLLAGAPLQLPIDDIDEDPDQPRQEFDPKGLAELAETIKERGVRQPISVRRHPEKPDRWMLNFGARRLRASKLVGKLDIPAFVDNTADSYDQVIENEQREGLKPLELALFVQRRLAAGDSRAVIARHLGKSASIVTYAAALIDAPDWLLTAYREGRCRGLRELYELRQAHEREGSAVEAWADTQSSVSRDQLQRRKATSGSQQATLRETPLHAPKLAAPDGAERRHRQRASARLVLEGTWQGGRVVVALDQWPEDPACALVAPTGGRIWQVARLTDLSDLALRRGE